MEHRLSQPCPVLRPQVSHCRTYHLLIIRLLNISGLEHPDAIMFCYGDGTSQLLHNLGVRGGRLEVLAALAFNRGKTLRHKFGIDALRRSRQRQWLQCLE